MKLFYLLFAVCFIHSDVVAQKKNYEVLIGSVLFGELSGTAKLDLNGENEEMITVKTTEKTKNGLSVQKTTYSQTINLSLVRYILINSVKYFVREAEYGAGKLYKNILVRLVVGNQKVGLFQQGTAKGTDKIFAKLKNEYDTKLVSIYYNYYMENGSWSLFAFNDCDKLKKKVEAAEPGYVLTLQLNPADRLSIWKRYTEEMNNCIQ